MSTYSAQLHANYTVSERLSVIQDAEKLHAILENDELAGPLANMMRLLNECIVESGISTNSNPCPMVPDELLSTILFWKNGFSSVLELVPCRYETFSIPSRTISRCCIFFAFPRNIQLSSNSLPG